MIASDIGRVCAVGGCAALQTADHSEKLPSHFVTAQNIDEEINAEVYRPKQVKYVEIRLAWLVVFRVEKYHIV
jgi:hypothetical protein